MSKNTITPEILAGAVGLLRPYFETLTAESLIQKLRIEAEQPQKEKYLSIKQTAEVLQVSKMTVHRLLKDGKLPKLHASKRLVRISESAILNFLKGSN